MLKSLTINNIVLIDKAEIDFSAAMQASLENHGSLPPSQKKSNLCILTGETGSGKSILLDALGLAIGFRSNSRLIGSFDNKAAALAEFDIRDNSFCQNLLKEHQLLDEENPSQLRIRRIISENFSSKNEEAGKSGSKILGKVFVNDNPVGVNLLAKIGETLVEIHGQHEQRGLLSPSIHLQLLDEFAGNSALLAELAAVYEELSEIDSKIRKYRAKKSQIEREKDYLAHVVSELETAEIENDEEEKLVLAKDLLAAKEKILNFASEFKNKLLEASSAMFQAQKIFLRNQGLIENFLSAHNADFAKISDKNDAQIDELGHSIAWLEDLIRQTNNGHENREEIEERLFLLRSLARKFNTNPSGLPLVLEESRLKLENLMKQEQQSCEFLSQKTELFAKYQEIAAKLSDKRSKAAIALAREVESELKFLKMPNCKFRVELIESEFEPISENSKDLNSDLMLEGEELDDELPKNYFLCGNERAKFLAAINSDHFDEITKIASGGELSRFMLALKVALMGIKSVPVMIFDEIDTGIGGATADAVGKRLKTLAKNLQILVVTHQPQIAAKADLHLKISKISANQSESALKNSSDQRENLSLASGEMFENKARTVIEILNQEQSLQEIARMISGDVITSEAISAAKALQRND